MFYLILKVNLMPNSSPVEDSNNRQVTTCAITNDIQNDSYGSD